MNFFKNLSIRYKILLGFFLILLIFTGFFIYFFITLTSVGNSFGGIINQSKKLQLFLKLQSDNQQLSNAVKSYILTKNPVWEKTYDQTASDLSQTLQGLLEIANLDEIDKLNTFQKIINRIQGTELLILSKTKEGDTQKAITLFDDNYQKQQIISVDLITALVQGEDNDFFSTLQQDNDILNTSKNLLFILSGLILLFTVIIAFAISSFIEKSIKSLVDNVNKIAKGDLLARVPVVSKDEIGNLANSFNSMAQKLQESYANLEQKVKDKTAQLSANVTDLENTKRAMLNVLQDLQLTKEATEKEKAKDDAILKSMSEGMVFTDQEGKIIFVNQKFEDTLELTQQEVVGKLIFEAFPFLDEKGHVLEKELRPVMQTLISRMTTNKTVAFLRKDTQKLLLSITSAPVIKEDILLGAIEVIRDITKEKEIDRMKTEFISLASHQLRTPLSAIKWFSEMLVGGDAGKLTDEQKEFAQNISDSTERMIELVNSLLNISRIESGRIVIDPKPTDLKELVESIVKELQVKITEKQQTLVISVHHEIPKINLDPKLIRQVYMNFLTNAIKYTQKGGEISIFISKKDNEIISQITDNGYGIPKVEQSKLFQKFFRAENVVKIETDGTGLGLYLVKAIIDSSHGKIWFESEEGKGTTFWFSLPMSGMEAKKGEVTLDE